MIFDQNVLLALSRVAGTLSLIATASTVDAIGDGRILNLPAPSNSKAGKGGQSLSQGIFIAPSFCSTKCLSGEYHPDSHVLVDAIQQCDAGDSYQKWIGHQTGTLYKFEPDAVAARGYCLGVVPQGEDDSAASMCTSGAMLGLVSCDSEASNFYVTGSQLIPTLCWIGGYPSFMAVNSDCSELTLSMDGPDVTWPQTFMFLEEKFIEGLDPVSPSTPPYDCDLGCEAVDKPVCGTDGITYFNECLAVCQDVEIEHNGVCPSDPPMNIGSIRGFKVTKAVLHAYKESGFKLTSIRSRKQGQGVIPEMPESPVRDGNDHSDSSNSSQYVRFKRLKYTQENPDVAFEYEAIIHQDEIPEGQDIPPTEGVVSPDTPDSGDSGRLLQPSGIIGEDTRSRIIDTTVKPYYRIVELDRYYNWGPDYPEDLHYTNYCSGAIIGKNQVLTAAHCVYNKQNNEWVDVLRAVPGRNGGNDWTFPWGWWDVTDMVTYKEYRQSEDGLWVDYYQYDIAIITLSARGNVIDSPIGAYMGTFGISKFQEPCSPDAFQKNDWRITGYPYDKPSGTMWDTGPCDNWLYTCDEWFSPKLVRHDCDATYGMSGSPIYNWRERINGVAIAVTNNPEIDPWNYGAAIDDQHLANIQLILSGGQLV